jgi:hypothetical protein
MGEITLEPAGGGAGDEFSFEADKADNADFDADNEESADESLEEGGIRDDSDDKVQGMEEVI